jgi:DNA-binding transcriptional regulator YdaS (Cro superfamily)
LNASDLVTKGEFAKLVGVSASRVSQWIKEGKLYGDALHGEGRLAKIRVAVALSQLRRTLDVSQRLGNGFTTDLSGGSAVDAPINRAAPADDIDDEFKRLKLEQLARANRNASREEAEANGRLTDAERARQQLGRVASRIVASFQSALPELADALAAKFQLSGRDVVHVLRAEFRKVRATTAASLRNEIEETSALVEMTLVDTPEVSAPGETATTP